MFKNIKAIFLEQMENQKNRRKYNLILSKIIKNKKPFDIYYELFVLLYNFKFKNP
jgi:hypothetical protein